MRFGLAHRLFTEGLAALGLVALVLSGEFGRWVNAALLLSLGLALLLRDLWAKLPRVVRFAHVDSGIVLAVLALQIVRAFLGADILSVLIEFAAAVQILRLATRQGAAHDQQIIVLALLHLVAGTVLGGGLGYGLCFFGVLVLAPGALALSHLRREIEGNYRQGAKDRSGLLVDVPRILRSKRVIDHRFLALTCSLSIPIFLFTAALFVLLPRVGLSFFLANRSQPERMVGFSERVNLGEVGVLRSDPTLALRLELPAERDRPDPPLRRAFHLRGTALDAYDGRAWTQSQTLRRALDSGTLGLGGRPYRETGVRYAIELSPIDPPIVFLPPGAHSIHVLNQPGTVPSTLLRGPEGELRHPDLDEGALKYEVFASPSPEPLLTNLSVDERLRYLQLPESLPARVADLAREWTRDASTPLAKAEAITRRLQAENRYDLASPSGAAAQPLDHFLFESHRGHCEYFSTALAVLLRSVDVPTRNVTGFVAGTYNRFGRFYAVRQGDAHAWVEAWIDGRGWTTLDPTPAAEQLPAEALGGFWSSVRDLLEAASQRWDRHVVGYDLGQQRSLYEWATSSFRSRKKARTETGDPTFDWRLPAIGLVALGLGALVYRRLRGSAASSLPAHEVRQRQAVELYAQLEAALRRQGLERPKGTPPLLHAQRVVQQGHPLGEQVLELTRVYLEVRFGERLLDDEERRLLDARIDAVHRFDPSRASKRVAVSPA